MHGIGNTMLVFNFSAIAKLVIARENIVGIKKFQYSGHSGGQATTALSMFKRQL